MMDTQFTIKRCRSVLESAWKSQPGYTSPNPKQYPWQWLWDSCFHAIAWAALGDRRAVIEMESLFSKLLPSGFLPNMLYHTSPYNGFWMWRRRGHSTITQPPMYGHTLRVLHESGFDINHLLAPATKALHYLIDSRLDPRTGLVKIYHPWESGCDDSPRWDRWMLGGAYNRARWNLTKFALTQTMKVRGGGAVGNRSFRVCSSMFNALVAFNAFELARLTGDEHLVRKARGIAGALEKTWSSEHGTWVDLLPGSARVSSSVATHEAFLPLLVVENEEQRNEAWSHLTSQAFLRPHGIAGVSTQEPSYNPDGYWRGGCWPQICYLLWVAAVRQQRDERTLIEPLIVRGILGSDFAEYWNPETGAPLGAQPQSWSPVVMHIASAE
jgi:hypothetical protein